MREAVYALLTLALASPAAGFEGPSKAAAASAAQRSEAPAAPRLDWTMFHSAASLAPPPGAAPARAADCAGVCAPATPSPLRAVLVGPWQPTLPRPAEAGRATLAWSLATGLSVFAGGAFGQASLAGQAAWPLGATVPAAKASAGLALDAPRLAGSRVQVGFSVDRNWPLDGPIGGAFPDCAVRLDLAVEALPRISARAPCGAVGHFGLSIHGRF